MLRAEESAGSEYCIRVIIGYDIGILVGVQSSTRYSLISRPLPNFCLWNGNPETLFVQEPRPGTQNPEPISAKR